MILPYEWCKLHYLYSKANNMLWERAAMINEAQGWKYAKFYSWEKSTSHSFLIYDLSRWPLLLSISAFMFITSLVYTFKNDGSLFPHGLVALSSMLYFMFSWINDLQKESNEGGMTMSVHKSMLTSFSMFLFSEVMVFVSCFWANMHFGLIIDNIWIISFPPKGLVTMFPYAMPLANVLTLLYSSLPLQAAQMWMNKGMKPGTLECVAQTMACGALFLLSQMKEYTNAYFCITDSTYGSAFYCMTGLHGLHVTLGVLAFMYLYNIVMNDSMYSDHHLSFKLLSWYWHLVDLVWVCLFSVIYMSISLWKIVIN